MIYADNTATRVWNSYTKADRCEDHADNTPDELGINNIRADGKPYGLDYT